MMDSGIPGLGLLNNVPPTPQSRPNQDLMEAIQPEGLSKSENQPNADQQMQEDAQPEGLPTRLGSQPASPQDSTPVTHALASRPDTPQDSPPVTHALEALLGGLDESKLPEASIIQQEPAADEHPEWEVDSSPIQSSSDESSSDDSSSEEDSDDEDNTYKLLSPEEQARILMEGDGGSDDEGGTTKAKGPGGQLRTKNEIAEEVIPKPDVTITPEMRIDELGVVETIVENIILVKAKTSGEYRALESGSVLCLADRSVIGVVSETLGRVQQPLYTVRFTNAGEITEAGVSVGTKVFYPEQHAKYALTQVLKAYKGSDASNLHDEEVGDEEMEFSDDEAEAEHKRRLKQKKLERRGGRVQQNGGSGRGGHGHPLQQQHSLPGGLSYDDAEDDGPYKPLARPTEFANMAGRSEAPEEGTYVSGISNRGGRGDFRGRGRGDRGRGRRDRGRGRGGFQDRRESNGYSQSPQNRPNSGYDGYTAPQQTPPAQVPFNPQGAAFLPSTVVPPNPNNFYRPQSQHGQYSTQLPPVWPQFPQQQFQQTFQGIPNMPNGWPNIPQPPMPAGAFINPAFFAGGQPVPPPLNQWNQQQGQQGGRGQGGSS